MKRFFLFLAVCCWMPWAIAQQADQHIVKPGETLYGLARQYNISVDALSTANPQTKEGLKEGMVLVIPASVSLSVNASLSGPDSSDAQYLYHKVQPKETLYGISKLYEVSIDVLEQENPDLATKGLQIDQVIRIPKPSQSKASSGMHVVQPGETVYSLTKKAGIDAETFFEWNPHTIDGLKEGQEVWLTKPKKGFEKELPIKKEAYQLYQVQPNDDVPGLIRKFGITADDLYALNPEIRQGLIANRYIIIPPKAKSQTAKISQTVPDAPETRIVDAMSAKGKKSIAVLLPFKATEMVTEENLDTLAPEFKAPSKKPMEVQMSIEFYSGFKMAMDTLAKMGQKLEVRVFDTKGNPNEVADIAKKIAAAPVDFVVGPLYAKHSQDAAAILRTQQIPVFSPLSRGVDNTQHSNLIACIPAKRNEYIRVAQALSQEFFNQKIIFVNTDNPQNRAAVREIRKNMQATDSNTVVEIWASRARDLRSYLHPTKENIFVVVDQNPAFLTDLVTKLFALKAKNIRLLSTNDLLQIETIEIRYLNEIQYTATELFFIDYQNPEVAAFVKAYRKAYNTEPSRFAIQGFDLGLYLGGVIPAPKDDIKLPEKMGFSTGFVFEKINGAGPQNRFVFLMELKDMKYGPFIR